MEPEEPYWKSVVYLIGMCLLLLFCVCAVIATFFAGIVAVIWAFRTF